MQFAKHFTIIAAAIWIVNPAHSTELPGKRFIINPKGSFYNQVPPAPAATSIQLETLKLTAGGYIGLRVTGKYKADFGPTIPPMETNTTSAVFKGASGFAEPADYGNGTAALDVDCATRLEDFLVISNRYWIYRVPAGAPQLLINPYQCISSSLSDPEEDYAVFVTRPNSAPLLKSKFMTAYQESRLGVAHHTVPQAVANKMLADAKASACMKTLPSIASLADSDPPVPNPQYRGWYKDCSGAAACWGPAASKFGARGGTHKGVDIFSPVPSPLTAPVSGCVQTYPNINGFGKVLTLGFKVKKLTYLILMGHLTAFNAANNSRVSRGQIVGTSGCGGNASTQWCYKESPEGGRSDHVHLELLKGGEFTNEADRISPARAMGWSIATPR